MLLYRGYFELFIFLFFLLSKEILFYGEERLITVCYLFLFFVGFFNLYEGINNDFNSRAKSIKDELDIYFYSIISTLNNTKRFIKVSLEIFFNLLILYKSIINEFSFYFLYYYNFSDFKRFVISYRATKLLNLTNLFFTNVKKTLMKKHNTAFLYNEFAKSYYGVMSINNYNNQVLGLINKVINEKEGNNIGISNISNVFNSSN
jgi:hypothetical protein